MGALEYESAEFKCEVLNDLAFITLGEGAFDIATELEAKDHLLEVLAGIEESDAIRGLSLSNTHTYPGDERYREFLDSIMSRGEQSRRTAGLRVSRYGNAISQIALRLSEFSKPTVARVSGTITGEQLGVMLPCDFRIASSDVSFTFPNVSLGFPPTGCLVFYLLQICGQSKTSEILLSPDPLSVEEALRLGLLSRVVAPDDCEPSCIEQLRSLAKLPPAAFAATRQLIQPDPLELSRFLDRSRETLWKSLATMDVVG